jgi:uncharacterized membrane protein YhhN
VTAAQLALTAAAAVSAALHIRADLYGPRWRVYLCKPLTTSLIIGLALVTPDPAVDGYREFILIGLVFSLAGDVFLMLPGDFFRAGLASFLVAHLLYIAAFSKAMGFSFAPWSLLPVAAVAGVLLRWLWRHLEGDRGPVVVYVAVIATMGWQALSQWLGVEATWATLALAGAASFMLSDATLAVDRFRGAFGGAPVLILGSYYAAQWLIALSVGR